jgi:hypothetical protein
LPNEYARKNLNFFQTPNCRAKLEAMFATVSYRLSMNLDAARGVGCETRMVIACNA